MTLTKFEIKKLFGEYDISMDLSTRCRILVGGNGVGKSTALRMLQDVYNLDWKSVMKYPFDSFILTLNADIEIKFKRKDFFPPKKFIKEEVKKYLKADRLEEIDDEFDRQSAVIMYKKCCELLDLVDKEGLLFEFFTSCYFDVPQKNKVADLIIMIESGLSYLELPLESNERIVKNILKRLYDKVSNDRLAKVILNKADYDKLNGIREATFFADMVHAYSINNKYADESEYASATLQWLSLKPKDVLHWKKPDDFFDFEIGSKYANSIFGKFLGKVKKDRAALAKKFFMGIDDFEIIEDHAIRKQAKYIDIADVTDYFYLFRLEADKIIEINKLINRNYYSEQFVIDFNKRALLQYSNCITSEEIPHYYSDFKGNLSVEQLGILKNFFLQKEVIDNIICYFNPILVDGSPLRFDIQTLRYGLSEDMDSEECQYLLRKEHWEFYQFYQKELAGLLDINNRNKGIEIFETLFREYSQIKNIKITPRGISMIALHTKRRRYKHLELIDNQEDEVSLSLLSSGEIKILLLLSLAIFLDEVVIILDEPELSLSILWQEKILPDLLNNTKVKKIVVATHSPYIAADDTVAEQMTFLPS